MLRQHKCLVRTAITIALLVRTSLLAQSPPVSPDRPWHSLEERQIMTDLRHFQFSGPRIESDRIYSLPDLIDLAEANNPETRVAWENARAQAASGSPAVSYFRRSLQLHWPASIATRFH